MKTQTMSDMHGIGPGMAAVIRLYIMTARGTGRTTEMLSAVNPGDRIVFSSTGEKRRVSQLLKDSGTEGVDLIVLPVHRLHELSSMPIVEGRTFLDHTLIEEFYLSAMRDAEKALGSIMTWKGAVRNPLQLSDRAKKELGKLGPFNIS